MCVFVQSATKKTMVLDVSLLERASERKILLFRSFQIIQYVSVVNMFDVLKNCHYVVVPQVGP